MNRKRPNARKQDSVELHHERHPVTTQENRADQETIRAKAPRREGGIILEGHLQPSQFHFS